MDKQQTVQILTKTNSTNKDNQQTVQVQKTIDITTIAY